MPCWKTRYLVLIRLPNPNERSLNGPSILHCIIFVLLKVHFVHLIFLYISVLLIIFAHVDGTYFFFYFCLYQHLSEGRDKFNDERSNIIAHWGMGAKIAAFWKH